MNIATPAPAYTPVARLLHWVIAGLIVVQYVLANLAEDAPSKLQQLSLLARHKSFGMTILMLAILRLLWRLFHRAPELPDSMKPWERRLATLTHGALYFLIFAMPLAGWFMSSARNISVSWFGLFTWPDLIPVNKASFKFFDGAHIVMAKILFVLAILHILAALKHYFLDRDDVMQRMLPALARRNPP